MKVKFIFLILPAFIIISGCLQLDKPQKRIVIARAGEAILYLDEIPFYQAGEPPVDTMAFIHAYTDKWAKKTLIVQKAENKLPLETKKKINFQVAEAKSNLFIHQYQQQMMAEKMDTAVTYAELEKYYNEHTNSFNLKTNIVKALFIKISSDDRNINRIKSLVRYYKPENMHEIDSLCPPSTAVLDDFNDKWISMDILLSTLPGIFPHQENLLKGNAFLEVNDSTYTYMIKFKESMLRSNMAPFEYVKTDILRIILNNRRIDFLQSLENEIFNEAIKNNMYVIFKNSK